VQAAGYLEGGCKGGELSWVEKRKDVKSRGEWIWVQQRRILSTAYRLTERKFLNSFEIQRLE
jgi:hypothetical protein